MKQLILILAFICWGFPGAAQQFKPVLKNVGKTKIEVDPRMELLCVVQNISGYPYLNREFEYSNGVMQFFEKDSVAEAVRLTRYLMKEHGFVQDAPLDLILRLSEVPELEQTHPFTPRTVERAGSDENLEKYRLALKQFASDSNFAEFWKEHLSYYEKMVEYTANDLEGYDPVTTINTYYNESKKSYTVVLSPLLYGGYGMRVSDQQNKMDIYGCLSADKIKEGIPYYSKDGLSNYLYHEFSHSFINPLTDNYLPVVEATSALFGPIEKEMSAISYGRWITCINEHIVRAAHIRILYSMGEKTAAEDLLEMEKSRRFVYIEPILEKLKQFEQERDTKNSTFTQFYPELMAVFDSISRSNNDDLINPVFTGPVQEVLGKRDIAIIYPTSGADASGLQSVFDYTSRICKMKGELAVLYPDTTALKTDLSNKWIMAYGTMESNLYLKTHRNLFPFQIEADTIYTDQKFVGENLRLITCVPNPQNSRRGMLINTAIRNQSLKGVMIQEKADYLVFEDISKPLQVGSYAKNKEQWEFPAN